MSSRLVLLLATALASAAVHAALPPVTPGERVLFSEDFADNRQKWSAVSTVNKTGAPAQAQAAIGNSEWTAALPADTVAVTSTAAIKPAVLLKNGPVSVYLSAKVADHEGTDGNRFSVALNETEGRRGFVRLVIRPAANGFIEFRDDAGGGQTASLESTRAYFKPDSEPRLFKLVLTPAPDAQGPATAEAFRYDAKTKSYVSLGVAERSVWLKTGELHSVSLHTRNGENGAAWIDSVVVTQGAPRR